MRYTLAKKKWLIHSPESTMIFQRHIAHAISPITALSGLPKATRENPMPVVMELETGDPDDILALLFLLEHPKARVKAIVMSPGSPDQIGLIKHLLKKYDHADIPVGAFNLDHGKKTVSPWYTHTFGQFEDSREARPGFELILEHCTADTTMLCCGPMRNLGKAIQISDEAGSNFTLKKVVIQGGFAGNNIIPETDVLAKFKDKKMVPSWNLDAAQKDTLRVLKSPRCEEIRMVSKNVCHAVSWDEALSEKISTSGLPLVKDIDNIMTRYREKKGHPKIIHDIVAAACALDSDVCNWTNVHIDHQRKAGWGASLAIGSNTFIVTHFHPEPFINTLTDHAT
jgi:pyrimidine-specific ribonucleoside hydrolase